MDAWNHFAPITEIIDDRAALPARIPRIFVATSCLSSSRAVGVTLVHLAIFGYGIVVCRCRGVGNRYLPAAPR